MKFNLTVKPKKQNGVTYNYYVIAQSYRDKMGKSQKDTIKALGRLTDDEVVMWRNKLKLFNGDLSDVVLLENLNFIDSKRFLDVALFSNLYNHLGLNQIYNKATETNGISTHEVAKILTICQCLDPQAKYKTASWVTDSYIPELLGIDQKYYNPSRIYRELDSITKQAERLHQHLLNLSKNFSTNELELYFLDATTSFFEGTHCDLGQATKDKTHGYKEKVILIFLVTDRQGYPILWDTYEGRKSEQIAFRDIAVKMATQLNLSEITFCFDRGMACAENFNLVENESQLDSKFISGIDKDQIDKVYNLDDFVEKTRSKLVKKYHEMKQKRTNPSNNSKKETTSETRRKLPINGFYNLGYKRFYTDLGAIKKKRYIVGFNPEIYEHLIAERNEHIKLIKKELDNINKELEQAQKNRESDALKRRIDKFINRYKLQTVVTYQLVPKAVTQNGQQPVQSFKIDYNINADEQNRLEKYDGILVYITNHIEKKDTGCVTEFAVSAGDIVLHYKNKNVIEYGFRYIKSILDLRPFYVWLPDHVKAHVSICMTAYFINNYIYQCLKPLDISLSQFYQHLENHARVCTLDTGKKGQTVSKLKTISIQMKQILDALGQSDIVSKNYLKLFSIN